MQSSLGTRLPAVDHLTKISQPSHRNIKTAGFGSIDETLNSRKKRLYNNLVAAESDELGEFDLSREIDRERRKINRFLEIKEQSVALASMHQEKTKKIVSEKEKKEKKRAELEKKHEKMRLKKVQENEEIRKMRKYQKESMCKEKEDMADASYYTHLEEVEQQRKRKQQMERELSQQRYNDAQERLKSASPQTSAKKSRLASANIGTRGIDKTSISHNRGGSVFTLT